MQQPPGPSSQQAMVVAGGIGGRFVPLPWTFFNSSTKSSRMTASLDCWANQPLNDFGRLYEMRGVECATETMMRTQDETGPLGGPPSGLRRS